jgi:hypothetical protein
MVLSQILFRTAFAVTIVSIHRFLRGFCGLAQKLFFLKLLLKQMRMPIAASCALLMFSIRRLKL